MQASGPLPIRTRPGLQLSSDHQIRRLGFLWDMLGVLKQAYEEMTPSTAL